jgi:hypothetical protein
MQQIAHAADVMLSVPDPNATFVDLSTLTEMTPALGSVEVDASGPRQGALLFSPGTAAEMTFADGSTQPLSAMTVRITELTVGADGPRRMPGELPPTSRLYLRGRPPSRRGHRSGRRARRSEPTGELLRRELHRDPRGRCPPGGGPTITARGSGFPSPTGAWCRSRPLRPGSPSSTSTATASPRAQPRSNRSGSPQMSAPGWRLDTRTGQSCGTRRSTTSRASIATTCPRARDVRGRPRIRSPSTTAARRPSRWRR